MAVIPACGSPAACLLHQSMKSDEAIMLNYVVNIRPASRKVQKYQELSTRTGSDEKLDRLQEQSFRIRYLPDTTVFFPQSAGDMPAAGNAEAAQSAYPSLLPAGSDANGVRSLKTLQAGA